MKNTKEGIGATINRFEAMSQQNIETFNELFPNCKLTGFDPSLSVVIGEYNYGLRSVVINDTITLDHEFSHIDYTLGNIVTQQYILYHANGETIGKFNSMSDAARGVDMALPTLRNRIAKGVYKLEELSNE